MKGINRTILLSIFIALTSNCALQAWPSWQSVKNTAAKYKDNVIGAVGVAGSAYVIKNCLDTIKDLPKFRMFSKSIRNVPYLHKEFFNAWQAGNISQELASQAIKRLYQNKAYILADEFYNTFPRNIILASFGLLLSSCCFFPAIKTMLFGRPTESSTDSNSSSLDNE